MGLWSPTISWLPGLRAEEAAHVCSSWVDKLYNVCVLRVSSAPGTESPLVRDIMVSRFLPSSATFPLSSTGCQHCTVLQPCPAASSAPQRLPWGKWRFYLVKLLCNRAAITALLLLLGPRSQQNQLSWAPAEVCRALLPPPLAKGIIRFACLPQTASDCSSP